MNPSDELDLFPRPCRSRHLLQQLRAGELDASRAVAERAHLDTCADCRARMDELEAQARVAREAMPFPRFAAAVASKAARPPRLRLVPVLSMALAASLAVAVAAPAVLSRRGSGLRRKGSAAELVLFVGGIGEPRKVDEGAEAPLRTGEGVRIAYSADGHDYLAVVSVDEGGKVTTLYPERGDSLRVEEGGTHLLPQSVMFDGAGRERLVAIFSDSPIDVGMVGAAAQRAFARSGSLSAMGPLGIGVEEVDRTVLKPAGNAR